MTDPYHRSPSISSASTRLTPSTSSTSTINTSNKSRDVSSGSQLLQNKLREKKAESLRVKKRNQRGELRHSDDMQHAQSSPVVRKESMDNTMDARRPSTSGGMGINTKKSMGAKEMEEVCTVLSAETL